jgi:hypothetical protein
MKPLLWFGLAAVVPVLAIASLEDPFEKRVLTPVNPHAYHVGLCPGAPLQQIPAPVQSLDINRLSVNARIRQDLELQLAMNAANLVYNLPDLEVAETGRDLVDKVKPFLKSIPKGYEPYAYISEPEAGMKYMILSPSEGAPAHAPWVLSIAGTQSLLDVMTDLNLGWSQLQKISHLAGLLTSCQYLDSNKQPMAAQHWIFTGHSLGGGLAQAFAYKVQKERLANHLLPVDLQLVTFNGFGAQELIQQDQNYDPNIANYLKAKNFFVKFDPISRIGTHIGPTFELVLPEDPKDQYITPMDLYRYHSMKSVLQIGLGPRELLSPLSMAPQSTPPPLASTSVVKFVAYAPILKDLLPKYYKSEEDKFVKVLQEAADYLLTLDLHDPDNKKTLQYVQRLILARIASSSTTTAQSLQVPFQKLAKAL